MKNFLPETMTLVRDNILLHKNPLAVSAKENSSWAADLNLPTKGELLFYTGGEYQILPFIDSLMNFMNYIDPGSKIFSWLMDLRGLVAKTGYSPEKIFASLFAKDKKRYFSINRKAAMILKKLGYNIAYDGINEVYSGALLHEMGFEDALSLYCKEVSNYLKNTCAETVVCLSPHAAEVFKYVYSSYKDFPRIDVKTFPELLWANRDLLPNMSDYDDVVIHDSCRLAREMGVVQELRDIFASMNLRYVEPIRSGKWTTCCGGPIKMIYPDLAHKLAIQRCDELYEAGVNKVVSACPFCLSALESAQYNNLIFQDLVELVAEGYGYE